MRLADICLMASCLVLVAIVAKMLRAIRLLDSRVTLLQEQLNYGLTAGTKARTDKSADHPTPAKAQPIKPAAEVISQRRTPAPVPVPEDEFHYPGEEVPVVIEQAEADAVWTRMEAEQERLRKAMGRDFQDRQRKRSASDVRGTPIPVRKMTSQEIARKLEHK